MKLILPLPLLILPLLFSCGSQTISTPEISDETIPKTKDFQQKEIVKKEVELDTHNTKELNIETDSIYLVDEEPKEMNDTIENEPVEILEIETETTDTVKSMIKTVVEEPHQLWDNLTRKHISLEGKVNYAGFLSDKKDLEQYLKELKELHTELGNWNKKKQLAYWINLYNAVTVKLIIDNYPVSSITELEGGKPWDTPLIELSGKEYTLNVIENKIIRPKYNEPRIHFAVNCAAKSCPKIMNKAWTEHNLERSLTNQTKAFIANKEQNTINENKVTISKIFDWYKADFGTSNENIIQFINTYSTNKINSNATVSYNEYDWTLNTK